jgi:hypothetical protein
LPSVHVDTINVGRPVTHHALVVGGDVPVADVIAPDDENVKLFARFRLCHVFDPYCSARRCNADNALGNVINLPSAPLLNTKEVSKE